MTECNADDAPSVSPQTRRGGGKKGNQNRTASGQFKAKKPSGKPKYRDEFDDAATRWVRAHFPTLTKHPLATDLKIAIANRDRSTKYANARGRFTQTGDLKDAARYEREWSDRAADLIREFDRMAKADQGEVVEEVVYRVQIAGAPDEGDELHDAFMRWVDAIHRQQSEPGRPCPTCGSSPSSRRTPQEAADAPETGERSAKGSEDVGALEAATGPQDAPTAPSQPAPSTPAAAERFGGGGDGRPDWKTERF